MRGLVAGALGLMLASGSSFAARGTAAAIYPDVMGCEQGCIVAASGWPLRYTLDYPGLSVAGRTDLFEAWLGSDRFHAVPFAVDWAAWAAIVWLSVVAIGRMRRRN